MLDNQIDSQPEYSDDEVYTPVSESNVLFIEGTEPVVVHPQSSQSSEPVPIPSIPVIKEESLLSHPPSVQSQREKTDQLETTADRGIFGN